MKRLFLVAVLLALLITPVIAYTWTTSTIDPGGNIAGGTSIALNISGYPVVVSGQGGFGRPMVYTHYTGTQWVNQSISFSGYYPSLDIDKLNNVGISQTLGFNLNYTDWTGVAWASETIDSIGDGGLYSSLKFNSTNYPKIAYFHHHAATGLKFAEWDGAAWGLTAIDTGILIGEYPSLALNSTDNASIAYYDANLNNLKFAHEDTGVWDVTTVDDTTDVGLWPSLAINSSDYPAIAYFNKTGETLKYAEWTGTVWQNVTIDSVGLGIYYGSGMVFDSLDRPHIVYYNITNGDLKHAYRDIGLVWHNETIDSTGDVGAFPSITIDNYDNLFVSYKDVTNSALKYAYYMAPPPYTGNAIYGLVFDNQTGSGVNGATVMARNTTAYSLNTSFTYSGIDGVYFFENAVDSEVVTLNATKSGYARSSNFPINTGAVGAAIRQDIPLIPTYTLALTFRDITSGALINNQSVDIVMTGTKSYSGSTSTGTMTVPTIPFGWVTVTTASSGYHSDIRSFLMIADAAETINLTSTSTPAQSTWYSPHPVRIAAVDNYGHRLPGVVINCTAIASTFPPGATTDWIKSLYGVNPDGANDMMNGTLVMSGTTAGDGATTFTMLASIGYGVNLSGTSIVPSPYTTTIYPIDSEYTVWLPGATVNNTLTYTANVSLTYSSPIPANYTLGLSYYDAGATTSLLFFNVTTANGTRLMTNQTAAFGTSLIAFNDTLPNVRGEGQIWSYQALHTDGSWTNASRSVTGKGPSGTLVDLGFGAAGVPAATATVYYNWISLGILYMIAAVAGSRDTRFFAVLIPVFAGLLWWMGWLSAVTGFDMPGMLIFLAVLAVAYYMKDSLRERYGSGGSGSMILNITFYLIILSAVVGLVNTSNLWGMGGMQMTSAVNNSYTNVDLSTQIASITGTGGILEALVSDVMILTQMAFSGLRAFLSIMLSIALFSLTITQIFPFITTSPMAMGLLVVFQVAIWLLYAKFIMDLFYKPAPGTADF